MQEQIDEMFRFNRSYWKEWEDRHYNNFYDAHFHRTLEYDADFIRDLEGRSVLEVGGYPGLEAAFMLYRKANVTVLDSPEYNPGFYQEFLKQHNVEQIVWDIVAGAPEISRKWDVAVMSDVLMHISGFPYKFMDWLFDSANMVILLNYRDNYESFNVPEATSHTLFSGFRILDGEIMIELAKKRGLSLVNRKTVAGRDAIFLERVKDERA